MGTKRLSAAAIASLEEALCAIFWYKRDLRKFLVNCLSDKSLVAHVDWENFKRQIVSDIVGELCSDQDRHLGDLRRLFHEVCKFNEFNHLERLDAGAQKAKRAREAVTALRALVETRDAATKKETDSTEERRNREQVRIATLSAVRTRLDELKRRYFELLSSGEPQKRGYELEKLLYEIFELFDLDPKASFRNTGEQVDGAFTFDSTDWLFEAKWHSAQVGAAELDAFAAKVRRKLDNTLGLFLSINGFSEEGVSAHSQSRPVVVLMTGADLMAVLEERVDFVTMLKRKRQHAGRTGSVLIQVHQFDAN